MKFEDFKQQTLQNPEVKTEYDQLSPQYELIRQIIKLRQEQQLTSKGFAEKTASLKVPSAVLNQATQKTHLPFYNVL